MEAAITALIPKTNPPNSLDDLRSISLTPIPWKILEIIIAKELWKIFAPKLDHRRFGNIHSPLPSWLYITSNVDKRLEVTTVTIDLRKVFDLINHTTLIKKMISLWIFCTCFGSTYTKIGTIQRRLACIFGFPRGLGEVDIFLHQPSHPEDSCKQPNIRWNWSSLRCPSGNGPRPIIVSDNGKWGQNSACEDLQICWHDTRTCTPIRARHLITGCP